MDQLRLPRVHCSLPELDPVKVARNSDRLLRLPSPFTKVEESVCQTMHCHEGGTHTPVIALFLDTNNNTSLRAAS